MAIKDKEKREELASEPDATERQDQVSEGAGEALVAEDEPARSSEEAEAAAQQLGTAKYVHAAFLIAAILIAFLSGKVFTLIWNSLAEWPAAVRAIPALLRYGEEERESFSQAAGALVGVLAAIRFYRKESIRRWADEVAVELSKVTWPAKDTVTNGTLVVVVASVIATVYVALLDKLWGFVTNLVYGA